MKRIISLACLALAAGQAFAGVSVITNRASFVATDDLNYTGSEFSAVANGTVYSTTGTPFNVKATSTGSMFRYDSASGWQGNFLPGEHLLYTTGDSITLTGTKTCIDMGAQIQSTLYGPFNARIEAYDGLDNWLGTFNLAGLSAGANNGSGTSDGSAIFIGIHSDAGDIHKVVFSVTSNEDAGFAINHVSYNCCSPVPEPASMSALGLGALALLRKKSKKA
ncbi:MAG: PEP-CTERM sorting domain-containing protein [Armatimonadetes bacterium]|nr:PEP-CTERM sorting domain-containing protein [Armatimonadota bacterium]